MRTILVLVALVSICACSHAATQQTLATGSTANDNQAIANGRSIFQTGKDLDGVRIKAAKTPMRPYCALCHHANGSGGVKFPDGAVSADLRHKALVTDQHPPYTIALLERAISTGIDNQGKRLDRVMPHWRLSRRDLHDVATYVYTQLR